VIATAECCVCDADVLVRAATRCGASVTFERHAPRKPVKLTLEKFVSAGGKDVGWGGQLSETEFTLKPCDEHTVIVTVQVKCDSFGGGTQTPGTTDGRKTSNAARSIAARWRMPRCAPRAVWFVQS
jgi:hypothetical protein